MTSADTRALIEEARLEAEKRYDYFTPTTVDIAAVADEKAAAFIRGAEWAAARLADALEASEDELARLQSVVAGVEALAQEWERAGSDDFDHAVHGSRIARRLRSVLSDTTEGDGHAVD